MNPRIPVLFTVAELFAERSARLRLTWLAPRVGGERTMSDDDMLDSDRGSAGHMSLHRPLLVQVIGRIELAGLQAFDEPALGVAMQRLFNGPPAVVIVADGQTPPDWLIDAAQQRQLALWRTDEAAPAIVASLAPYLQRRLGQRTHIHGVFLDVMGVGVLILGDSSIGKSELGLELISRGAGLVADDVVELQQVGPDYLQGQCPGMLRDYLEVRGLGVLNIKTIFGETQVRPRKTLNLVVQLRFPNDTEVPVAPRLASNSGVVSLLGVELPQVTLTVKAGRNLAVLVEAAVRTHVLQTRGVDTTAEFIARQHALMAQEDTDTNMQGPT
jgi:HPr kinase/phosphorylase